MVEQSSKVTFCNEASQPFKDGSICIKEIEIRLVGEPKRALEGFGHWIVGIEITEFDPAIILCFEPMNHGRHCAAGRSGEAEEFDQL